tara:strand:- start:26155 stop:26496 length:342 start_codon:yes stop_codon:yes gene_type:complete
MTLELEKEKILVRFSLRADGSYSPISRYEHIPQEDQDDLVAGEAGFYAISIEATLDGETHHFISQGMIMSHDDEIREEEFEAFVASEGGLMDEVITRVKVWTNETSNEPRWSK